MRGNCDGFDSYATDHKAREQINNSKMTHPASEANFATYLIFTASRRLKVWSCSWTWRLEDARPTHLTTKAEVNAMTSHGSSFLLVPFVLGLEKYEELLLSHMHPDMHPCSSHILSSNTDVVDNMLFLGSRKASRGLGSTERIPPKQIISGEIVG